MCSVAHWCETHHSVVGLEDDGGPEKLFFEFSSENRLLILLELRESDLKMQEIARTLDLTATDAFRQLQRLCEASLVEKRPSGAYSLTEYGKLLLRLLPAFKFVFRHEAYFLTHDLSHLPDEFVSRIGELSGACLATDAVENLNRADQMAKDADRFVWAIGVEQPLKSTGNTMIERAPRGIQFRFLFPGRFIPSKELSPSIAKNVEWRGLENAPVTLVLTDKEAAISFCSVSGKVDYTGFIGKDEAFLKWIAELFNFYWEKGTP